MSGLAQILLREGFCVSGSDAHKTELTEILEKQGARIDYGQRASNIRDGIDVVVYTAAIHPDLFLPLLRLFVCFYFVIRSEAPALPDNIL